MKNYIFILCTISFFSCSIFPQITQKKILKYMDKEIISKIDTNFCKSRDSILQALTKEMDTVAIGNTTPSSLKWSMHKIIEQYWRNDCAYKVLVEPRDTVTIFIAKIDSVYNLDSTLLYVDELSTKRRIIRKSRLLESWQFEGVMKMHIYGQVNGAIYDDCFWEWDSPGQNATRFMALNLHLDLYTGEIWPDRAKFLILKKEFSNSILYAYKVIGQEDFRWIEYEKTTFNLLTTYQRDEVWYYTAPVKFNAKNVFNPLLYFKRVGRRENGVYKGIGIYKKYNFINMCKESLKNSNE